MINLTIGDLKEINQLLIAGKLDSALQEAKKLENSEKANEKIKNKARLIKAQILNKLGLYKSALEQTHAILNSLSTQDLWMIVNTKILSAYSLIQMNKAIEANKIIENTIKDLEKSNPQATDFRKQKKAELNLLNGLLFEKENNLDESLKLYLKALSTLREIDNQYGTAEALNLTGRIYFKKGDTIRSLVIYEQSLEIFRKLNNNKEIACILDQVGLIYLWKGEYGPALENCLQSLAIRQELNYQKDIANSYYSISDIYFHLGELNRALEYLQKSLSINEELDNQLEIGLAITALSRIFYQKGELQQAMIYNQQAETILQKIANEQYLASALLIKGKILTKQGNIDEALEIFKKCLSIRDKYDDKKDIGYILFWLILLNVEKKSLNQAQLYLQRLKIIHERQPNNVIDKQYRLASGLVLKHSLSPEIIDTSTKLFKEVVDGNITDYHIKTIGLFYLCELLINEYKYYGNYEALHTVEVLINKHLQMAEQIESQLMIADNFWLKAQLAKAKEKTQDAIIFLNQAQQVTEEIGYLKLAAKITSFRQILGEGLESSSNQITRSIIEQKNSHPSELDHKVVRMIDKTEVSIPKIKKEEPVLLLIVYEGGVTVFSKKFSPKEMIDEMFVGGFLTAIDAFMHQTFATSGSIERIKHQEYTLLMKVVSPLLFCYAYKGQSYSAIQKLDQIVRQLQNSDTIYQSIIQRPKEELSLPERKYIEELAQRIFVND